MSHYNLIIYIHKYKGQKYYFLKGELGGLNGHPLLVGQAAVRKYLCSVMVTVMVADPDPVVWSDPDPVFKIWSGSGFQNLA